MVGEALCSTSTGEESSRCDLQGAPLWKLCQLVSLECCFLAGKVLCRGDNQRQILLWRELFGYLRLSFSKLKGLELEKTCFR